MKFDLVSDIHADHWPKDIYWPKYKNKDSDILVIAGDIANKDKRLYYTLKRAAEHYKHVLFVDGNHEHYDVSKRLTVDQKVSEIEEFCSGTNTTLLNKSYIVIDDVAFVGANGWYDWKLCEHIGIPKQLAYEAWLRGMNDSVYINFGDYIFPDQVAKDHATELAKIVAELQNNESVEKIVMITHTAPLKELVWIKETDHFWNQLSASYGNSLMENVLKEDINKKISVWCYGHTHIRSDRVIDNVRYVINARGYCNEIRRRWELEQINPKEKLWVRNDVG